jgi:hypothetical protein
MRYIFMFHYWLFAVLTAIGCCIVIVASGASLACNWAREHFLNKLEGE